MADSKVKTQLVIEGKNTSQKAFNEAESQFASLSKTAVKAGAIIGTSLAVSAGVFAAYVKSSIDAIDKTDELAERAGVTSQSFAGLQYAAKFASIEGDGLATTLSKLNQNAVKASQGSKAQAKAFDTIGVSVLDAAGNVKSADVLLLEVADRFAQLPDGAQKSALAIELFGKSGAKLLPLLNRGADGIQQLIDQAKDLGLVLDQETYKAAGDFNDQLDVLGTISEGVGQQMAASLLPSLNSVSGLMIDLSTSSDAASDSAGVLSGVVKVLTAGAILLAAGFKSVGQMLGAFAAAATQLGQGNVTGALDTLRQGVTDYAATTSDAVGRVVKLFNGEYEQAGKDAAAVADNLKKGFNEAASGMGKSVEEAEQKAKLMKSIQDQLVKDSQAALNKQVEAQRKANQDLSKAKQAQLDTAKRYADALANLNSGSGGNASYGQAQSLKVAAEQALKNGDTEKAKSNAQAALEVLRKLQDAGENTYGFEGFIRQLQAVEQTADQINVDKAQASVESTTKSVDDLKQKLDAVKKVDITLSLPPEEIAKIQTQMQELAKMIGQTLTITPTILAAVSADPAATANTPGYATGTNSAPPGLAWVGENGPELMQMAGGERIYPADISRNIAARLAGTTNSGVLDATAAAAASVVPAGGRDLGTIALNIGGRNLSLLGDASAFDEIQRLRVKRGRTTS